MTDATRILVVEDDRNIVDLIRANLSVRGYDVIVSDDGSKTLWLLEVERPDLVILDLTLPGADGFELCREIRERSPVGIIVVSARRGEHDKVSALNLGADDYITKPFSMREFRSRVKAALRRAGIAHPEADDEQPIAVRGLRIDPTKRTVVRNGETIATTFVEFEILTALARTPGRVFTRDMLLARVWGDSAYRDPRTIDVHIRHLREKIETDPKEPEYLFTVRGVGYRFRDEE